MNGGGFSLDPSRTTALGLPGGDKRVPERARTGTLGIAPGCRHGGRATRATTEGDDGAVGGRSVMIPCAGGRHDDAEDC